MNLIKPTIALTFALTIAAISMLTTVPAHADQASGCTNLSGNYLMGEEYDVKIVQTGCEKLLIATEVGSETLVIDGIEHTIEDYDGNLYIYKIEWNEERTEIITQKRIIILGQDLFTIKETYSLLATGDFQYLSEDRFESGSPRVVRFVYTKKIPALIGSSN